MHHMPCCCAEYVWAKEGVCLLCVQMFAIVCEFFVVHLFFIALGCMAQDMLAIESGRPKRADCVQCF